MSNEENLTRWIASTVLEEILKSVHLLLCDMDPTAAWLSLESKDHV